MGQLIEIDMAGNEKAEFKLGPLTIRVFGGSPPDGVAGKAELQVFGGNDDSADGEAENVADGTQSFHIPTDLQAPLYSVRVNRDRAVEEEQ